MEFTEDLLKTLYDRVNVFAITKYGNEPDRIELQPEGYISARWIDYHCGEIQEDTEYIYADDLTADLDEVARLRAIQLEEDRKKAIERQAEIERQYNRQQKEKRKAEYLKLKKEFE